MPNSAGRIAVLTVACCLLADLCAAQTPLGTAFTYQGRLDDGGSPASGPYDMHFRLYDAAADGAQLGPIICYNNKNVADGLFTVTLDFGDQFAGQERFLEIAIRVDAGQNCADTSGFTTLAPRQKLSGAPNALFSLNTDKLDGLDSTAFLQSVPTPLTLSGSSMTHIIRGENAQLAPGSAGVYGISTAPITVAYGVLGRSASTDGCGVRGEATAASGTNFGGWFSTPSSSGMGVFGQASATSGTALGVYGESASPSGTGVYGLATLTSGTTKGGYFESRSPLGIGVEGRATAGTGASVGVRGISDGDSGMGVFAAASNTTGSNFGLFARSNSTSGTGVFGRAYAPTGTTYGVYGVSDSTDGRGVTGFASAASGVTYGGRFQSDSTAGRGVYGRAIATTGDARGVYGISDSSAGLGVTGYATATTGTTYGVYGQSDSSAGYAGYFLGAGADALYVENSATGRGAHVVATADTAIWASTTSGIAGVDGRNASTTGRGLYGYATASTGTNYGVYGRTSSSSGYGVYSLGNTGASGTKSFQIDHPRDPENKYLLHYSTESPEVLNAYSGKATLDGAGGAIVALPPYFASINKDPRYTLTAVGAPMPMLHVAEEISEAALKAGEGAGPDAAPPTCSFRIAGGAPGARVSWRVEAVRNDLRMRMHGAPVEREKFGPERGKYQHPEYYGQPPTMGMDYHEDNEK